MNEIESFGKIVACEPIYSRAVETSMAGGSAKGFATIASKTLVVPLTVVYGDGEFGELNAGDVVYVRQSDFVSNADWVKEVTVEGEKDEKNKPRQVVLIPTDRIVLVRRKEKKFE